MQTETTTTVKKTIDLQLPFFRKRIIDTGYEYLAVLSDGTFSRIFKLTNYTTIHHGLAKEKGTSEVIEPYLLNGTWSRAEEGDFFAAHIEALKSLSLEPQLTNTPAADPNDLQNINI